MTRLAHLTIQSGHLSFVSRDTLSDGERANARDLLARALQNNPAAMAAPWERYFVNVVPYGGALRVAIGALALDKGKIETIATFGVAPRARSGVKLWEELMAKPAAALAPARLRMPPAPWCAVVIEPDGFDHQEIFPILADLQAAIAWAWIDIAATASAS